MSDVITGRRYHLQFKVIPGADEPRPQVVKTEGGLGKGKGKYELINWPDEVQFYIDSGEETGPLFDEFVRIVGHYLKTGEKV